MVIQRVCPSLFTTHQPPDPTPPESGWGQNRYSSLALACQLSPTADIDRPERLGQVRITERLSELGPWASSGDRADSAP
jgi:hypothetical protein